MMRAVQRARMVSVFVTHDGRVLLSRSLTGAKGRRRRWDTLSAPVAAGVDPAAVASALVPGVMRAGLPVLVDEEGRREPDLHLVAHPYLVDGQAGPAGEDLETAWFTPDEVIVLSVTGETAVAALDELLARVWDPPAALPLPFRDEARALSLDRTSSSSELAIRAAALVSGGAPAERVAALRPSLAVLVNAARAAAVGRDVFDEIGTSELRARDALAALLAPGQTIATVGKHRVVTAALAVSPAVTVIHEAATLEGVTRVVVGAEAMSPPGDALCPVGSVRLARLCAETSIPFTVACDSWRRWPDDVLPPAEEGLEVVPRALMTDVI
jgi:hypothetical protein